MEPELVLGKPSAKAVGLPALIEGDASCGTATNKLFDCDGHRGRLRGEFPVGGFGHGTLVAVEGGQVAVQDMRPGMRVEAQCGELFRVVEARSYVSAAAWASLPAVSGASSLIVSSGQLLFCRHFLCKALFGAPSVLLRAGAVTGPGVQPASGSAQTLYDLRFETPTVLQIGGYEFYCCSSAARDCRAAESGWAGGDWLGDGRGPHFGIAEDRDLPAQPLLTSEQARQLCDARVIFRGISGGVRS